MIVFSAITPHPPIIIPGIGSEKDREKAKKTIEAMEILREQFENAKPDVLMIISPHAEMEAERFVINNDNPLRGSFINFGLDKIYDFENDFEATERITYFGNLSGIPTHLHGSFLDHGALVPLHYLTENIKPKIIHLAFSFLDFKTHYEYGRILNQMCCDKNERIAIVASGDMSHRVTPEAPAGYSPRGKEFDEKIIELLSGEDTNGILSLNPDFVDEAGECGLRSIIILLGALGEKYKFNLLGYEAPFGVGYLTALFEL